MGAMAATTLVDDDAAMDSQHTEDAGRYTAKKPLTINAKMAQRCRASQPHIDSAAERHRVDPWLMMAIAWVESGFSPTAVSRAGSRGLMQLQPVAGHYFGCRNLSDPACNADAATRFVKALLRRYRGDMVFALCAYHAGPARPMKRWKQGEVPANLHYATRVLEARSRLERFGCDGHAVTAAR